MARVVLVQVWPRNPATGAEVAVRLAGGGRSAYTQLGFSDWRSGAANMPRFTNELPFEQNGWTGGAVPTTGVVRFFPSDLALLTALAGYVWQTARISVTTGDDATGLYADPIVGKVAAASVESGAITITFADLSGDLTKVVLPDTFAGTGGIEGGSDATGRVKRRSWGKVFNVEGLLLNTANNVYEFGNLAYPLQSFVTVRDKGASGPIAVLGWQGSIQATYDALAASSAPSGGAVVAPSIACVKWWTVPSGPLTADIQGEVGAGYVEKVADIAKRLVDTFSTTITVANLADANTWKPGVAGIHAADSSETVGKLLDRLLAPTSIIWTLSPSGAITFRRWKWTSPVETLASDTVARETVFDPLKSRIVGYQRNYRIHSDAEISAALYADDVYYQDGSSVQGLKPSAPGATNSADPNSPLGNGGLTVGQFITIQAAATTAITDLQADAASLEGRITSAEGELASHTTTLATYGSSIAANALAISNTAGDLASLTITVRAGSPNLLKNGDLANGLNGFTGAAFEVYYHPSWGNIAALTSPTTAVFVLNSDPFPVEPNVQYTISADCGLSASANMAVAYVDMLYFDSTGAICSPGGDGPENPKSASFNFTNDGSNRNAIAVPSISPSNAVTARGRFVVDPRGATVNSAGVRLIKVERGSSATAFTNEASVSQAYKAISSTDLSVATLSSIVTTQGATVSSNSAAISTLNSDLATLTTRVVAGNPNLLKYGNFEAGLTGWTVGAGTWTYADSINGRTAQFSDTSGNPLYLYSDFIPNIIPGASYTVSSDAALIATGGLFRVDIEFWNGTSVLGYVGGASRGASFDFDGLTRGIVAGSGPAPSGSTRARVRLIFQSVTGCTGNGVRGVKLERGSTWTPFTQEASIVQSFSSLSTLTMQYSDLSTTVSVQGVTVSSHTTALADINGALAGTYSVIFDISGRTTGAQAFDNGSTASWRFITDQFSIEPPSGSGAGFYFANGALKVKDTSGTTRVQIGDLSA